MILDHNDGEYLSKLDFAEINQTNKSLFSGGELSSVSVLGVPISLIDMGTAVRTILRWTEKRQARYICARDVHGVMLSMRDPEMMRIHKSAGMVTSDGMPIVWICKLRSKLKTGRVCGADLMDAVSNAGQAMGLRHYFYGGKAGVPEVLIRNLSSKYPYLSIAGFHSPPFRALTEEEDAADIDAINKTGAQIVWVGLSTPKQEFWMRDHVGRIRDATLIGVGAAFDFHSGAVARAPKWMQRSGLEWLHRLVSEPRRLWRRYLIIAPLFLVKIIPEQIALWLGKKRQQPRDSDPAVPGSSSLLQ